MSGRAHSQVHSQNVHEESFERVEVTGFVGQADSGARGRRGMVSSNYSLSLFFFRF